MIDQITEVLQRHLPLEVGPDFIDCRCGETDFTPVELWTAHVAEKIAAELADDIPEREFTDDLGRQWEWCGGQPRTWAWRVTAIVRQPTPSCKCTPESCRIDCSACTLHTYITGRGCIAKITGYPGEAADVND
jgi:hypothetical protein